MKTSSGKISEYLSQMMNRSIPLAKTKGVDNFEDLKSRQKVPKPMERVSQPKKLNLRTIQK
jgi:hypothetical protein